MNLNWKRILILIGFLALVVFFGYLLYFFFLKPAIPTTVTPTTNTNVTPGGLPQAGTNVNIQTQTNTNGGLKNSNSIASAPAPIDQTKTPTIIATGGLTQTTAITQNKAYQSTLSADGQAVIYYDKATGLFYRTGADGKSMPISDQVFYSVQKVNWSPDKEKAIIEYPDGSKIYYDFNTKKQVTLPSHWKDFSFSPTSEKLVFKSMGTDPDNRWLAISNADGSMAKKIELLNNADSTVYPSWSPSSQSIAMYTEDQDFNRQNLYFIGVNNENFKSTIIEGRGLQTKWSSAGDRLLYSVYTSENGYKPSLWIVEAQGENIGQNRRSLKLETWANKCTFNNNDTVFCAVPQTLQEGAGLFANELDNSPCDLYKIDLKTGLRTKIAVPEGNPNIENIMVSQDQKYLYFTNKTDGKLYKINLK